MNTKDEPGPFDGMERAKPGEPIFTLQGGDPTGGPLVMLWAALARCRATGADPVAAITPILRAITREENEEKRAALLIRAREAEGVAWQMDEYRKGHVDNEKPEPAAPLPTYSGNVADPAEVALKAQFDAHRDAARRFDNAVAEIDTAATSLVPYGVSRYCADDAIVLLKAMADAVRPKRPSYAARGGD